MKVHIRKTCAFAAAAIVLAPWAYALLVQAAQIVA